LDTLFNDFPKSYLHKKMRIKCVSQEEAPWITVGVSVRNITSQLLGGSLIVKKW